MSPEPMVQDFTDQQHQLSLHIDTSESYEFLLTLFVHGGDCAAGEYANGDSVSTLIERHASPELRNLLSDMAERGWGTVWLGLIGTIYGDPRVSEIPGLIAAISETDAIEIRRAMLEACGCTPGKGAEAATVERAVLGDAAAVADLIEQQKADSVMISLLEQDPDKTRDHIVSILERFYDEVWLHLDRALPVLERDAAEKRAMARTMSPERLVEAATNGVTFDRQGWMSDVVLIPSAISRPWVLITDHGSMRIFCYPVDEEHLNADPTAPPGYLVDTFKALGDEKRLRILSVLDGGENQLTGIAEKVGLAKSTAHHHLRVLRAAGLVRAVLAEGGSRYEIRRESILELGLMLSAFLPGVDQNSSIGR